MAMFHDKWSKNVSLPLGAAWGNGMGGVAACMVWRGSEGNRHPLGKSIASAVRNRSGYRPMATPTVVYEPRPDLVETSRQTGSLVTKYVPTPPPPKVSEATTYTHREVTVHDDPEVAPDLEVVGVTARSSGSRLSTYRDDTYRSGHMTPHPPPPRGYVTSQPISVAVAEEAIEAHQRKLEQQSREEAIIEAQRKLALESRHETIDAHRRQLALEARRDAIETQLEQKLALQESRQDYLRRKASVPPTTIDEHHHDTRCTCHSKKEAWSVRDDLHDNQYYGHDVHPYDDKHYHVNHSKCYDDNYVHGNSYRPISRPASVMPSNKYRTIHYGSSRRPHTATDAYTDHHRHQHGVTWADDVNDHVKANSSYRHPCKHFNDWRHRTTSLAKDVYVTPDGQVVRVSEYDDNPRPGGEFIRSRPRSGGEYWKMSKFTKNAKPRVVTRWAEDPRQKHMESPGKVKLHMECADDSDMMVNVRVRSANPPQAVY